MAINTREKRQNITGLWTGISPVAVTPNASKDIEWRQEAGWGYSGITPNNPVPPPPDVRTTGVTVPRGIGTAGIYQIQGVWWATLRVAKPFKFTN